MVETKSQGCNEFYNQKAKSYKHNKSASCEAQYKNLLLEKYVSADSDVLEVGCASGDFSVLLAEKCKSYIGLDYSEDMVEEARKKLNRLDSTTSRIIQGNAECLKVESESTDICFSFATLLLVEDYEKAISEMSRVTRPGGLLILDLSGLYNYNNVYWNNFYKSMGHFGIHRLPIRKIKHLLKINQLKIVEQHSFGATDHWKSIKYLCALKFINRLFHGGSMPDLDYKLSNFPMIKQFARRWYLVVEKNADGETR